MSAAAGSAAPRDRSSSGWIVLTVATTLLVTAALAGLYMLQDRLIGNVTTRVSDLRQGRLDLYQGYMHVLLGRSGQPLWNEGRGLALMDQGVAELQAALRTRGDGPALELRQELDRFAHVLHGSGPVDARADVELRVAFSQLDVSAVRVDRRLRDELQTIRRTVALAFSVVLSVSGLLLALVSIGAVRSGRREAAARAAHGESEARFRQLAESIREVFWLSDLDTQQLLYVTPAYESIWGRPVASLMAQPGSWRDAIHPDDAERVRARVADQPLGTYDLEYRVIRPDGTVRWVRARAFPVRDGSGRVYRVAGVAEDITERHAARSELRDSERRLRQLIDLVPHAIYAKDAQGRYLLANRATAQYLGRQPEELLGRGPEDFGLDPAHAARDREVDREVLRTQRRHDGVVVRRFRGSDIDFAYSKIPFSFAGRGPDAVLGVSTDITSLNRAAAQQKRAAVLLEATLESTHDGVLVTGPDGALLLWNEQMVALLGGPGPLLAGDKDRVLATLGLRRPGPGPGQVEQLAQRADGRFIEAHAQPMLIDGAAAGRVWSFRDVTEREQALADAHAREQELEARVEERTRAMAQAYAELQSFSDAVSHDLRAPLAAIDAFAQALLRKYHAGLAPPAKEYLDRIVASCANMRAMIHGLLELSRHARAPVHRRALDLGAMAHQAYELQAGALGERRVEFEADSGLEASGDPVLVATLLQNLVGNALKYSRERDPARVRVGRGSADGRPYYFVRDNGAGFDPAYADRLFKPFSRLHRASEFEGHGIGLATASRIVARHGGRIWAEGAPGQGATFCFTLE